MVACVFISVFCCQMPLSPVGGVSHASMPLLLSPTPCQLPFFTQHTIGVTLYFALPAVGWCAPYLSNGVRWLRPPTRERSTLECWPTLVAPTSKRQTLTPRHQTPTTKHQTPNTAKQHTSKNTKQWHQVVKYDFDQTAWSRKLLEVNHDQEIAQCLM